MSTADHRRLRLAELIRARYDDIQAKFIAATGQNQGEISALLRTSKSFGEKKARAIEAAAKVSAGSLDLPIGAPFGDSCVGEAMGEKGESADTKGLSESAYNRPSEGDNFVVGPDLRPRMYPEISWVQAGMWTELCDNFAPDESTVWHQCHIDLGPCGFVVTVRGPSMTAPPGAYPSFPDGIKLFVSPDTEVLPGKFVVVRRDNKATFKKLTLVDGDLYLEALNPEWPERYIKLGADDHFCGVVRHAGFDV